MDPAGGMVSVEGATNNVETRPLRRVTRPKGRTSEN